MAAGSSVNVLLYLKFSLSVLPTLSLLENIRRGATLGLSVGNQSPATCSWIVKQCIRTTSNNVDLPESG